MHKCLWIGLLENITQSIEMLEYQTGLRIQFGHGNKSPGYPQPTEDEISKLKKLMPVDLYIYEYAKKLFELRWRMYLKERSNYQGNSNVTLSLPSVIDGCVATRHYISCPLEKT